MIKSKLFLVLSILFFLSCNSTNETKTAPIVIKAGTSKVTGRIINPDSQNKDSIEVTIFFLQPISGENVIHTFFTDSTGKFSLDYELETETTLFGLSTSLNKDRVLTIRARSNEPINIEITYGSDLNFKNVLVSPAMNPYDLQQSMELINKTITYKPNKNYPHLYNKSIEQFLDHIEKSANKRLDLYINKDNFLSKEFKEILSKDFRLFHYSAIFNYENIMKINYSNSTRDRVNTPNNQKIDRTYFRFLKDLKLNDSQYLLTFTFNEFQNEILQNEILDIPEIGDSDIPSWLAKVRVILSDLVGFDQGQYYDILAANAYGRQLNEELRPLSEQQKEHISQYWKNGEIAKILFRKNQQVIELDRVKSPTIVNDISTVKKDKIIETILSKHKENVIFIDFWATWCGPCLEAIKQFRKTKGDFHDKDVVFIYLTNGSSPKKLWEEKIKGIGSEHYYLTSDQWYYILDHFGFEGIPSYLLYDKKGKIKNKFTSFPGNEEVKNMINDLLK